MNKREEQEEIKLLRALTISAEEQMDLLEEIRDLLQLLVALFLPKPQSASTTITQGASMGTATTVFVNPTTPPVGDGSGLTVTYTSSDSTVAAFDSSGAGSLSADGQSYSATYSRLTDASFTVSTVVANTSGAALVDANGLAFEQPADVVVPAFSPPPTPQSAVTTVVDDTGAPA